MNTDDRMLHLSELIPRGMESRRPRSSHHDSTSSAYLTLPRPFLPVTIPSLCGEEKKKKRRKYGRTSPTPSLQNNEQPNEDEEQSRFIIIFLGTGVSERASVPRGI